MATRSTIAMEHEDGTVTAIYCHWDGYPDHNGAVLKEHYTDRGKLAQLLALGDISSLAPGIGEQHPFDYNIFNELYTAEQLALWDTWVMAYHRDRHEALKVNKFTSYRAYKTRMQMEEYNYVLRRDADEWRVYGAPRRKNYARFV